MKNPTLITLAVISLWTFPIFSRPLQAATDHNHSAEHSQIEVPNTRESLCSAIQTEHVALQKAIADQSTADAHAAEEKLESYLRALAGKVADLEETARKRIEGQLRNLTRAYDAVHHACDEQAWDQAAAQLKKAEGSLHILMSQALPKVEEAQGAKPIP